MTPIRVLLADDHRMFAEGLRQVIERDFDLVGIVQDGQELLSAAQELRPDVIVADISMPRLNGVEALEELRKTQPNVRLVFLTMHQNPAYARRALDAGALGYVVKHSAVTELVQAVIAAAAGRTFVSPAVAEGLRQMTLNNPGTDPALRLTLRQREILRLLVDGLSAKQIARELDISARTVEFHKYSMMQLLDISTSAELIRFALQTGIHET